MKIPSRLAGRMLSHLLSPGSSSGMSEDELFFLDGATPSVLKVSTGRWRAELARQFDALCWLDGKLPAPRPLDFQEEDGTAALWMTWIDGEEAQKWGEKEKAERVAAACAGALLLVHALDIGRCPLDESLEIKVAMAEKNAQAGLVDEDDFDEERQGLSAEALVRQLRAKRPRQEDLVFTHGDFCLPNILFKDGRLAGLVDWGRCGIADRYQDLALLLHSLERNFGSDHRQVVAKVYGIKAWDEAKLEYYRLLDEFF